MAAPAKHEVHGAATRPGASGRPALVRLLLYVRPYLGWLLLVLVLSLAFSGGRYLRAYLIKPGLDDVALPLAVLSLGEDSGRAGGGEVAPDPHWPAGPDARKARAAVEQRVRESAEWILLAAIAIVVGVPLVLFAHEYIVEVVLGRIHIDIKRDLCAKLLALPLRFHREQRRGDVLSRTIRDVDVAHGALRLLFADLLQSLAMIGMGVGVLAAISWPLALVVLVTGPLFFALLSLFGRRIRDTARRRQEQYGEVTQRLLEILAGISVIKAFRAEAHEHAAYRRETRKLYRRSLKAAKNRILARTLVEALNHTLVLGVLGLGLWMVGGGLFGLSPGDLAAFAAVMATTYRPTKFVARTWVQLADAQPAAERFLEVLDAPIEIHDAPDAIRLAGVHDGVRLRNVSFSYGREPVLEGVSLEARPGEVVALVGRTGAGKTTVADLLLRFHDPDAGSVEIDGIDLRRIARDSLLDHVAVVTQEPFLFDGTIAENICYGRPGASRAQMLAAARAAHVDAFVRGLPEGYETPVGVAGARLSGGQRQRVTIARALLKDPDILICDEATSALDARSERLVRDAIDAASGGRRIVIVIAHRLSTIRRADRIVVLEGGRVAQTGTHEELLRDSGIYRQLVDSRPEGGGAPALPAGR